MAVKFLKPELAADLEAVRDLKVETRRCLGLSHDHVVRVHDFMQDAGHVAIAMEFVAGESLVLRKSSAPGGCLSVGELAPLVAQLCTAISNRPICL
jgi:serine/threonine protein kinase